MKQNSSIEARWTKNLGKHFCPVSSYFLANYHKLRPHDGARGLNSTEAMLIIHLVDHKWDQRAPYPTLGTLATRMSLSTRAIRSALRTLEELGYVLREPHPAGGPNRYHLNGLFEALEALQAADIATQDKKNIATHVEAA